MPIVAKSELARRTIARAADAAKNVSSVSPAGKPASRATPSVAHADAERASPDADAPAASTRTKRRGHAVKDEDGKWQPTGDYGHGFARTPEHSRFKPGGKGGPGRPKGSVSHDKLLAKHLSQKREVSLNGRRQQLTARELLIMTTVKAALEGKDKHARAYVLAQNERLFRSQENAEDLASASSLSSSDALSLAEFEEELRERLRAELKGERDAGEGEGR
jgi:hypothetical protein